MPRPTVARIDLGAVAHNVRAVKGLVGRRKVCAAVKADAYGHGAPLVALAMSAAGVDMFGVATTEEAVELREAGVTEPILLLCPASVDDIDTVLDHRLTACVADVGYALELSERALRRNTRAPAHVNIDTGMRRVGVDYERGAEAVRYVSEMPGIELTGIFTHFACSGSSDLSFSREQMKRIRRVCAQMEAGGLAIPFLHVANSAAVLRLPESYFDGVRPGLILYGLYPPNARRDIVALNPVLGMRTELIFCKTVPAGERLGYDHTFRTWRKSLIATLPVGYHDGFIRQYSNCGEVLVGGRRVPVVGRVCMDQALVDVTDVPGVQTGDEAVIYGEQGTRRITVEEMAQRVDRIPYELTCAVGERVRRQFVIGGETVWETTRSRTVPAAVASEVVRRLRAQQEADVSDLSEKRGAA